MEKQKDQCLTVLVGAWNQAIFTPEWVSKRLFDGGELDVAMQFGAAVALQLRSGALSMEISPRRLTFAALDGSPEVLAQAKATAIKTLEALRETPMIAIGVNFAYQEHEPSAAVSGYLEHIRKPLRSLSPDDVGVDLRLSRLRAAGVMNVLLRSGPPLRAEVNYHWELRRADAAAKVLGDQNYEILEREAEQMAADLLRVAT